MMFEKQSKVRFRLADWLLGVLTLFYCIASFSSAQMAPSRAIVFMVDASNSMNANDSQALALDAVREMVYTLPSDWPVGLVAYNTGVQVDCEMRLDRKAVASALDAVRYEGYTDAGAGLARAVQLLEAQQAAEKAIVLFTDGEIMLEDAVKTAQSKQMFDTARAKAADLGVSIYTVALGGLRDRPEINIYGAEKKLYEAASAEALAGIARRILFEPFAVPRLSVSGGGVLSDELRVKFPLAQSARLERARILLVSDSPVGAVSANYQAGDGTVEQGRRFALVDLQRPQGEAAEIRLDFARNSRIWADLLLEMRAEILTEAVAGTEEDRLQVRLTPVDAANRSLKLLADPYFAEKSVPVFVDGEELRAEVDEGALCFSVPADPVRTAQVKVDYAALGVHVIAPETVEVFIAPPKAYGKLLAAAALCAALLAALLWWRRRPKSAPEIAPLVGPYEYAGMLRLYVMQAPDDSDVAPMVYNLYRCFDRQEISLGAILESCKLSFALPGAPKILFAPGANKALVLTNRSDCTVLKNKELLVKGRSCLVHFNEGVHITFEDERSAMLLEYKNVKPSERH